MAGYSYYSYLDSYLKKLDKDTLLRISKKIEEMGPCPEKMETRLDKWFINFNTDEENLMALKLFLEIECYSEEKFRKVLERYKIKITQYLTDRSKKWHDVALIAPSSNTDSARRHIYELAKIWGIADKDVLSKEDFDTHKRKNNCLIFFNDTHGTGKQFLDEFSDFIRNVEEKNCFIVCISITEQALQRFKEKFPAVTIIPNDSTKTLSDLTEFTGKERELMEELGKKVYPKHPMGFGDCGLLVAYHFQCPNNNLPIVWANGTNNSYTSPDGSTKEGYPWMYLFEYRPKTKGQSEKKTGRSLAESKISQVSRDILENKYRGRFENERSEFLDLSRSNLEAELNIDILQLLEDNALSFFHPLLEELRQLSRAKHYPPEVLSGFLDLIHRMLADIQDGKSMDSLLKQAIFGHYVQPDWDVHSVFQKNKDSFQRVLKDFRDEIKSESQETGVSIPIVLLVMNETEARALEKEEVFQSGLHDELRADFQELRTLLEERKLEWTKNYAHDPEKWRPFINDASRLTIKELLEEALAKVKGCVKPLIPEFVDIRTLNNEDKRSDLTELRDGCVVIMDILSMRHPDIQREFRRSLLDVFPHTLVASIPPFQFTLEEINHRFVIFDQYTDLEFYKRFDVDCDDKCRTIKEGSDINRWIRKHVPDLLSDKFKVLTDIRKNFFK